jgi:ribonuclease P protein subunit POP4
MSRIYPHELIGQDIEIVASENQALKGLRGKIVDETKETFVIKIGSKRKRVFKRGIEFLLVSSKQKISGESVLRRSEERLK